MALHAVIGTTTFHVGDTVSVHYKIVEQELVAGKTKRSKKTEKKERVQIFEGIVIAIGGTGNGKSFTVRRIGTGNIAIERIFPVISPWIAKVTVKRYGAVRRSKLYYLRENTGKNATFVKEKKKAKVKTAKKTTKKSTAAKKKTTPKRTKKSAPKSATKPKTK